MRPVTNLSNNFLPDQKTTFEVKVWDTPFSVLDGTADNLKASVGMQLRVREPGTGQNWTDYSRNFQLATATTIETQFLDSVRSQPTKSQGVSLTDGRTPLVQHYWGSGAPNWWGGSVAGQVAMCFAGQFAAASERGWFSSSSTPTLTFAAAGSGLIKIVKVPVVGDPSVLLSAELSEVEFLQAGLKLSTSTTFAANDIIRVYYLQKGPEAWGGLVVKVIAGTLATTTVDIAKQQAEAPVLSAGLFSHTGTVSGATLQFVKSVDVQHELGSASRATLEVPLMTPTAGLNDGHGWLWDRTTSSEPGSLKLYDLGALVTTLRRKRLIQITAFTPGSDGLPTIRVPVFTGFIDDFSDVSGGIAKISCVSLEGRLVEQFEQAPDRISYMARGFRLVDLMRAQDFQKGQPVYNVPAFDAWPVAYAVEELGTRAGIDPSRFRKSLEVLTRAGTVSTMAGVTHLATQVRAFTPNGTPIRLPRPVNYGNAGIAFTENRPFDDSYLFKIEPTKDLWARVRELTDRVGYRVRFDEAGNAALYPANNASHVYDFALTDVTATTKAQRTNIFAFAAKYIETTGTASVTKSVTAARIDVVFPRQVQLGDWTVTIKSGATTLRTVVVSPGTGADTAYAHLYQSQLTQPDANSCVVQVWPDPNAVVSPGVDTLTVELASSGGTGATVRAIDCILAYAIDPNRSLLPIALSTGETALSAVAQASQDDMRNKVTIVGRRKALVTDSDKFAEAKQPTEQEFVVQNEVDAASIIDPTAKNYVGFPKQSVIYDESIGDNGFARYLAKTFIYRQRMPKPAATVESMLLPMIQLGDAVQVTETRYKTMENAVVYVKSVAHRFTESRATTSVSTQAWPDWPAFEPRYDIVLADFNNIPVSDVNLNYTTLSGHAVTNLNGDAARPVSSARFTGGTGSGSVVQVAGLSDAAGVLTIPSSNPWPPMPGTLQVRQTNPTLSGTVVAVKSGPYTRYNANEQILELQIQPDWIVTDVQVSIFTDSGMATTVSGPHTITQSQSTTEQFYYKVIYDRVVLFKSAQPQVVFAGYLRMYVPVRKTSAEVRQSWVGNNPYHEFTTASFASTARSVTLSWKQGDESARFARASTSWDVRYKALFPNVANTDPNVRPGGVTDNGYKYSPFYDPYTSELGYLINVTFTSLAEGLYRASIRSAADDTVVAWLTNSTADASAPDKHWQYLQVGVNEFFWDGVDQVGEWNTKQSELYATLVDGAFTEDGDQRERVGKGFYAWNREVAGGSYPPLAHIWLERDATTGRPYIGHGTYGQWYVLIESVTDQIAGTAYFDTTADGDVLAAKYIYTHLPEPTKVQLQVRDWTSTTEYNPDTPAGLTAAQTESNWGSLPTTVQSNQSLWAFVHNGKPVRLRLKVQPRPGVLWYIPSTTDNTDEVSVKLTRYAHMRVQIGDQTLLDRGALYPGSTTKDRVVVNRRLTNDEHTNSYPDEGYRKAKTLRWAGGVNDTGTLEWIFRPKDFKREFRYSGIDESVEFGNYLQIEEVPGWPNTRDVATQRAKLQFAVMSYLFYLSTMVQDRSGRTTWALNTAGNGETGFKDQSKIVNNTTAVGFGDDPMYQLRRTVVCRQWAREPDPTDATTSLTTKRTWVNAQLTKFGSGTTGALPALLEHLWLQHDAGWDSVGVTYLQLWSAFSLPADAWSAYHYLVGAGGSSSVLFQGLRPIDRLPSGYDASRQLGGYSGGSVSCSLTGWSWSTDPVWVPSITRDLHPYFLLPPMILPPMDVSTTANKVFDPLGRFVLEYDLRKWNCFITTAGPPLTIEYIEKGYPNLKQDNWSDAAHAETFSSAIWDHTEASAAKKRFFPATKVDKEQAPCKANGIAANTLDYVRQDETVHWEDLRGMYSRGKLPAAGVNKTTPSAPYYINTWRHFGLGSRDAFRNPGYPAFYTIPRPGFDLGLMTCFRTAFRHEYVWESGSFFPANERGAEALQAMQWWRTQYLSMAEIGSIYYDSGAWVGWKDDVIEIGAGTPTVYGGRMKNFSVTAPTDFYTPFAATWIPVAVSSVLPTTVELAAHLVLVPERRGY